VTATVLPAGALADVRRQLEGALQITVFGLVVALALASSNIDIVNIPVARLARWALLGALAGLALAYALLGASRPRRLSVEQALAAAFVVLALVSTAWSPDSSLTLGRSLTLLVLFVAGVALAVGSGGSPRVPGLLLLALLAGAVAIAVGGLVELPISDRAHVPANIGSPVRYNGLGANPNTMPMLFALALPLTVWALLEASSRAGKLAAAASFLLLDGSIVASGSRGALAGAGAGLLVLAVILAPRRWRVRAVATVVALVLVNFTIMQLPPNGTRDPEPPRRFGRTPPLGPRDATFLLPLHNEIGFPKPGDPRVKRGLFETSGRVVAWRGALEQTAQRPVVGFGFGTEEAVFVDRYYLLLSSRPENSYVGTALQLGAVGSALLLALLGAILVRGRRALARPPEARRVAAACAGLVVAGLVIAGVQSYLTAVGSPTAAPFWLGAFLLAALAAPQPERSRGSLPRSSSSASATSVR
jgi:hypothetical protein